VAEAREIVTVSYSDRPASAMSGNVPPRCRATRCAKNFRCALPQRPHLAIQDRHGAGPQAEVNVAMGDKKPAGKPSKPAGKPATKK
jgi:hypothetical protein